MKRRHSIAILISLILLLITVSIYINISDNRNTIDLPNEVSLLKFEFTNVYLIPISDGFIMIDNAYEKEYSKLVKYLEELDISIDQIKYVLITHHHDDHVGFLNQIASINPSIQVIMGKETAKLLTQGKNNISNGGGIVNVYIHALFKMKQILTPDWNLTFPAYIFRDNDLIIEEDYADLFPILGIDIKYVNTPGHTSDSITFIYNSNVAFCGDLASNYLNWAGARYLTLFNEDIDIVYKSWNKLINLDIESIATAHGKPFHIKNLIRNLHANSQDNIVRFF